MRRNLVRVGIHVNTFIDPRSAIENILADPRTDLLILDLTMPDFDGIEVMTTLANFNCRIPIFLVSGWWPETLELAAALGRGIGLYIVGAYEKPFDIAEVSRHLGTKPTDELDGGKIEKLWTSPVTISSN